MRGRCKARLERKSVGWEYHGRCDLPAGHTGAHELERGLDTVFFETVIRNTFGIHLQQHPAQGDSVADRRP